MQTTTTFCLAMWLKVMVSVFICHRPPHLEICVKNINGESRFRVNERRWCLFEFCIKHLFLGHCQGRMKGAHGHQWTRITENLQTQTTITKSAFCQTLGRDTTTFEQAYLRKLCRRERGMGGNSSSVWFIETSTTSSFQKDIRIQA